MEIRLTFEFCPQKHHKISRLAPISLKLSILTRSKKAQPRNRADRVCDPRVKRMALHGKERAYESAKCDIKLTVARKSKTAENIKADTRTPAPPGAGKALKSSAKCWGRFRPRVQRCD